MPLEAPAAQTDADTVHMSKPRLLALSLVACLASGWIGVAHSVPPVVAKASWAMVDMAKDVNNDGFIDGDGGVPKSGALSANPSTQMIGEGNHVSQPNERLIAGALSWYLSPTGFPVTLIACGSQGSQYSWSLVNTTTAAVISVPAKKLSPSTCKTRVTLPEGNYTFTLNITEGAAKASVTTTAIVKNILMVAMGDSYASGEGNPRNVGAWLTQGGPFSSFRPYWDNDVCRRSVHGAPALAALALEKSSPLTSVTLVDVSCSGATVRQGILGTQPGTGQTQIALAKSLIGDQPVDLVSLSIGGNDVGFGSVLSSCLLNANCPLSKPSSGVLQSYPTLQAGVSDQTAKLQTAYSDIANCLSKRTCPNGINLAPTASVLPTMYPDIARNSNGAICSYLSMNQEDFTWARAAILNPTPPPEVAYKTTNQTIANLPIASSLNRQITNTTALGWKPVLGSWTRSGDSVIGHGICAGATSWTFGVQFGGQMSSAAFHPNPQGQVELGKALLEAAKIATA
jgi:lysophospholipase L1-like esterase